MLHPTHVCLDLVGRELWVVDRERVGESEGEPILRMNSVVAGEETVHYASVRMEGSDKDTPITCTREMYEYCKRVYKPSKTGDGDAGAAASAPTLLQLPIKRVRVVKYKPHLSALESRVQGLLNIFLFRSQFLKSKLDAQEVVHNITKTGDSSSLDYDKLHDQFSPTLLSYFEQLAKNVLKKCPFEFNAVIDRFGKYAHNQLPANVQGLLSHIGRQAKRYPVLFAGLLLLMLLTLSGVLPLLLLVVSASLLSAGGLMLVSPELKQFLDPKQWKSTLRMLVRSFYQGNTTVVVSDTGDDGEKAAGGELYGKMKQYAEDAEKVVKQYATDAEKTVKQHLTGLSDGERKCDLSMEPVIFQSPGVASGAPVSTSAVPTVSDDVVQCVYISCDLERPKHIQTVDEYTRPGLREARFLAKGLYFVAPDGKLFAFVKPVDGKAKQDENDVSPFRALVHVSDLCKFCRYPANDNKNQLIGEDSISTQNHQQITEIDAHISIQLTENTYSQCYCIGTTGDVKIKNEDRHILVQYVTIQSHMRDIIYANWKVYVLGKSRGGDKTLCRLPYPLNTAHAIRPVSTATQINDCWWFGHCKPTQPNTLYIDGTDDKLDIPTGSERFDATTISTNLSKDVDLTTLEAAIIDVNEWNDSSQTILAQCKALKVLYVKGTATFKNKMPAVPSCVRHLVVGSHSDRFGDDADGETRCQRWTTWMEAQTVEHLETLVLNTPVECTATIRLRPKHVHVQFMDVGTPDDPWHGFCGTGRAETKQTTVHLRYIPALADDTSVLHALDTVAQSVREHRIDIRETICVQWCDASKWHTTGNVPTSQRLTFLRQWREQSAGGVHHLYESLRRQFAGQSAVLQALSNRIPFGLQSKAFAAKFKEACRPAFNLPPPAGEAPLRRLTSYFTAKYLSEKECSIDRDQLKNSANAQKLLNVDWQVPYPAHQPHILVAKDASVWFYTPLQLNCVCVSAKRPSRAMADLWKDAGRGVLTRDKAKSQPIINITHDKLYAIEFDNIALCPTSKVYAYSLTTQRCYPLRHTTVKDAKGQGVKNGAWGSLDGPHNDLTYPFELLLKFLLQGVVGGSETLHHLLGGKGYSDELMCFTVHPTGKLEWLTAKTDGRHELQPYGAGTFQHIVTGLHAVLQRLSESKTYAKEMLQTRLQDNLVRAAMKHRGLLFKTYVKSLRDGTASHIQRFKAYVARVLQRLPKALGTLRNRLRRNEGIHKAAVAADNGAAPTKGGTRKRPTHRPTRPRHRRRPPASTQRRRLAKRTRRRNHSAARPPALRSD